MAPRKKYRTDQAEKVFTDPSPKVSSGAAAVGATLGAVVGFAMPFPGAVAIGAAAGGLAGKFLGSRFSEEDDAETGIRFTE